MSEAAPAAAVAGDEGGAAAAGRPRGRPLLAPLDLAALRLWSGLVLLAFAATHLANHALGLVSLAAMEAGRGASLALWRSPPAELLLVASLLAHVALSSWRFWQRRSLRMGAVDLFQLATGVLVPFWLVGHVIATAVLHRTRGVEDSYAYLLGVVWPNGLATMTVLVLLVWSHGCLGLDRWLGLRPRYRPWRPAMLLVAVMLPVLALLGVVSGGRDLAQRRAADPAWAGDLARAGGWPEPGERRALVSEPADAVGWALGGLLAALVAARGARRLAERRATVRLRYPGGVTARVPRGLTVLEASRLRAIPHASVCGGRGRCSTCQVRVGRGADRLPPPSPKEARVLSRINAPPDVRLACQIRPSADLAVTPLVPPASGLGEVLRPMDPAAGVEREVAVMFADLRAFTRFSERHLPYDTVFVLNRYFEVMGSAVERAGGRIDKFIGDGIMALFGVDGGGAPADEALDAARRMALALDALNGELAAGGLGEPLRMGIGLHLGPAVVGEMGYGRAVSLTAVGDTVNVASRLEALTKELDAGLVASERLARRASAVPLDAFPLREVDVRGRSDRIEVRVVADAKALPARDDGGREGGECLSSWWGRLRQALAPG